MIKNFTIGLTFLGGIVGGLFFYPMQSAITLATIIFLVACFVIGDMITMIYTDYKEGRF